MSRPSFSVSHILLDDGGVMNDNSRRAPEWQRLVGEYLAPRLGGDPAQWATANAVVFAGSWQRWEEAMRLAAGNGYAPLSGFWTEERQRWLREMCEQVGVEAPAGEDCLRIAEETEVYVIPRIRSAYPGAARAIRELRQQGYDLGTASGEASEDLERYLAGMGILDVFTEPLYGPDLVNTRKDSTEFYQRVLADSGVEPAAALIVDDSPNQLRHAAEAGAETVLVSSEQPAGNGEHVVIQSLAELPDLLGDRQS